MSYLGPSLRRSRKRDRPYVRFATAVVVSLAVNVAVLTWIHVGISPVAGRVVERPIVLAPLSLEQWEANRRITSAQPVLAPPAVAAPVPPPPNKVKGQVVDVAPSKDTTPPKDSRFLAEHDSTVEKETRSRYARPGYENTLPVPSEKRPAQRSAPGRDRAIVAGEAGRNGVKAPGARPDERKPVARSLGAPGEAPGRKLALKLDREGDFKLREPRQGARGNAGAPSQGLAAPEQSHRPGEEGLASAPGKPGEPLANLQLRPSAAAYDRLAGGPAPDRLDGVQEGEGTYLNTRGWKYAGYFNRISQAVRGQWDPNGAMRERDPSGARFGDRDWFTLLLVKLDDHGGLKDVAVQRSSGLDFLDNAAVLALRRAQPFVNPPTGLADARGEIVFTYGFTLEGSFGLERIFRRGPSE